MKRADFVRLYAERSGLSPQWADIGLIDCGGKTLCALPCGCEEVGCEGWAMLGADSMHDHLFFHAPTALREAYQAAVGNSP